MEGRAEELTIRLTIRLLLSETALDYVSDQQAAENNDQTWSLRDENPQRDSVAELGLLSDPEEVSVNSLSTVSLHVNPDAAKRRLVHF